MAKTTKRTVEVDFSGVSSGGGGGGFQIPEGEYAMIVDSVEMGTSGNGNEQIMWQFKGTQGKAKGKTFYFYTPLVEQALWKLRQTLEALGADVPDSAMDIDLDELEGIECVGTVEDDEYQGKKRSKLVGLVQGDGESEEEEKPVARKKNGKADKVVKVSEDEVKDMTEDELEALVEKHSLDIDLSDYKVLRKKMTAVVAALEENNLLEG